MKYSKYYAVSKSFPLQLQHVVMIDISVKCHVYDYLSRKLKNVVGDFSDLGSLPSKDMS